MTIHIQKPSSKPRNIVLPFLSVLAVLRIQGHFVEHFSLRTTKEHKHSGIGLMAPEQVHYGQAPEILAHRSRTLEAAFKKYPNRFKGKMPTPMPVPEAV